MGETREVLHTLTLRYEDDHLHIYQDQNNLYHTKINTIFWVEGVYIGYHVNQSGIILIQKGIEKFHFLETPDHGSGNYGFLSDLNDNNNEYKKIIVSENIIKVFKKNGGCMIYLMKTNTWLIDQNGNDTFDWVIWKDDIITTSNGRMASDYNMSTHHWL